MSNIFSNLCPKCKKGKIISGIWTLNKECKNCSFKFEREPGYFTGAMIIACLFVPMTALPTLFFLVYIDMIIPAAILSMLQVILLAPFATRYSWIAWIQLDHMVNRAPLG